MFAAATRKMQIQVKLLDHTQDPVKSLYLAYRTAYSSLTPMQIERRVDDGRISREKMEEFIERRLQTGHASPLEQIWFEFGISGPDPPRYRPILGNLAKRSE